MLKGFKNMSPRQKQVAIAVAGAGVLALVVMLGRGRGGGGSTAAAATDTTAVDPSQGAPPPFGSSFADNGAAAGDLSTAITGGLGDVALGLETVNSNQQAVGQALADLPNVVRDVVTQALPPDRTLTADPSAATVTPAAAAVAAATPNGDQRRSAPAARGTFTQTAGTRAGLDYKVVVKGGKKSRFYESARGRGDFGKSKGSKVGVGAAKPKPKPAAKPKPKPKAKAPAHRQAGRPSRPPAHTSKPPARRKRR